MEHKTTTTAKDFFLYLGMVVTLYVSAVSLISLWFAYINEWFPSALDSTYYGDPWGNGIRLAIAFLIIVFPLYIVLTRLVNQDLRRTPAKKNLWIRKWLLYFTLFIAGATVTVDLVVVVNAFLGGEITARFISKVLVVLVVAAIVFGYYLMSLKGYWDSRKKASQTVGWIMGLIVLGSLICGFVLVGSPSEQRDIRLDRERISDLQSIQWEVVNYWQDKEELPQALTDLEDSIAWFEVPHDPETGEEYTYRITGERAFELCAVFARETEDEHTREFRSFDSHENWTHGAGEHCFDRTIDPDRFPPRKDI